jgi:hypothetical protein
MNLIMFFLFNKQNKESSRDISDQIKNVLIQDFRVHAIQKHIYKFIHSWSYYINIKLYLVLLSIQPFSFILNKYVILVIFIWFISFVTMKW